MSSLSNDHGTDPVDVLPLQFSTVPCNYGSPYSPILPPTEHRHLKARAGFIIDSHPVTKGDQAK